MLDCSSDFSSLFLTPKVVETKPRYKLNEFIQICSNFCFLNFLKQIWKIEFYRMQIFLKVGFRIRIQIQTNLFEIGQFRIWKNKTKFDLRPTQGCQKIFTLENQNCFLRRPDKTIFKIGTIPNYMTKIQGKIEWTLNTSYKLSPVEQLDLKIK